MNRNALRMTTYCRFVLIVLCAATATYGQTVIKGGATEVAAPQGQTSFALSFTNMTGVAVCDLVISRGAGAWNINGALVDDAQHADEDWDVDDDNNGAISMGAGNENAAAPGAGAGMEGGGGAATAHADNMLPAGAGSIRVQEVGADANNEAKCIQNNRNFQVTIMLSAAAAANDTLRIQPTNLRDANLFAFADGLYGDDETWLVSADTSINSTFSGFANTPGTLHSIRINVEPPANLTQLFSQPPGLVDLGMGTVSFVPPINSASGVLVEGTLSTFSDATVIVTGEQASIPTVSTWGILVLALLILVAATLLVRSSREQPSVIL